MAEWNRRHVMQMALGTALAASSGVAAAKKPRRPNILFILADDLGYADLSCYGRDDYQTPHLDALAAGGLKLTHAYANSAVCSPTRLALMTGRYQYRLPGGLDEPLGRDPALGLPPEHPTLASLLRDGGYRTSLVGKWHLGVLPQFGPLKSGYQRFFGTYGGGLDYFTHALAIRGVSTPDLWEGEEPVTRNGYLTDLLTDRAIEELGELARGDQPFLMSLHYTSPHWPWEGPGDDAVAREIRDSFHYDGGSQRIYAEMVQNLDTNVGRVLAALRKAGLEQDTIVIFTSDNGGERFSKMWPFTGMKGELLEGGIRVPTLMRWPARIAAGSVSDQAAITMDWLPTLLAAAGLSPDPATPPDGENLLPVLTGAAQPHDRTLFWRHHASNQAAMLRGHHKYLRLNGHEYLFDLAEDPRERANLKAKQAPLFAELQAAYTAWNATMLPYPDTTFSHDIHGTGKIPDRY